MTGTWNDGGSVKRAISMGGTFLRARWETVLVSASHLFQDPI